jgi:hypothetical protein
MSWMYPDPPDTQAKDIAAAVKRIATLEEQVQLLLNHLKLRYDYDLGAGYPYVKVLRPACPTCGK